MPFYVRTLNMPLHRWTSASAAAVLSTLAGCASVPDIPLQAQLNTLDHYAAGGALAAPVGDWPADHWWERYGDPQLDRFIDEALRDSPTLVIAQARLEAAKGVSQFAGAARLPEVRADAGVSEGKMSYAFTTPKAQTPHGWNAYGVAALNFNWELDFWGKNRSAFAAAVSEQRATQVEVAEARLMLASSVSAAYAELAHLYALRTVAQGTLQVRTHTVTLIESRQRQELETLATLKQVQAREASARAELDITDERIALQKNAIAALIGAGPDRGQEIQPPSAKLDSVYGLPSELALDLVGRRPDIVAARLRTEAAASRIHQHKAEFYPSVNLMGFGGLMSMGLDNLFKGDASFGGGGPAITLPVFNTERLQGQLRGAHAEYNAAVAAYNATLTNALHEIADVITSRRALDSELTSLQASVSLVQQSYDMVNRRYEGGLATYLDVLSVEDTLLTAQRGLSDTQSRTLALDVALAQALGGGFAESKTN